jgi:hypothetical protein
MYCRSQDESRWNIHGTVGELQDGICRMYRNQVKDIDKIMVDRGVNKLPWSTTLIYDRDSANNALSAKIGIATMLGIDRHRNHVGNTLSTIFKLC